MLGERMNMDKKIAIVAVLAAVAVIAGYVIVTYAQETSNTTSTVTPTTPGAWIPLKGYGGFSSVIGLCKFMVIASSPFPCIEE
ncbi:MAG: hypothetical protein QW708_03740 [Desulfurococcaceae archaeon]